MAASFWRQYKAMLRRNFLIKQRNWGQIVQEILCPMYFVLLLDVMKYHLKPTSYPALTFPPHSMKYTGNALTSNTTVLVSPDTQEVSDWMEKVSSQLPSAPAVQMFPTASAAEAEYRDNDSSVVAGIAFNMDGDKYSYAIRFKHGIVPAYDKYMDDNDVACRKGISIKLCPAWGYLIGFVQLQLAIENTLLQDAGVNWSSNMDRDYEVQMMDMDEHMHTPDTAHQAFVPFFFVLTFSLVASFLAVNLVTEKETKIRVSMEMMGLRKSAFWLSWATLYGGIVVVIAVMMSTMLVPSQFFERSDIQLLFLIISLYGLSIVAFTFMITPFFKKAKTSGEFAATFVIIFSLMYLVISQTRSLESYDSSLPPAVQLFLCLFSPVAFATCMDQALFLDIRMQGFGFDDSLTYGKFPLCAPIVMLVVDILLYSFLTVYLDHVIPGEYGVRYSPFYLFHRSHWQPVALGEEGEVVKRKLSVNADMEEVPDTLEDKVSISIVSLTKSYKVEEKTKNVVDDFNLDIYSSQITCLLGHNGAGKTTLMNMLTGVVPPTSGHATIMGLNITKSGDLEQIRQNCGVCPQHNILQDVLSCREQLEFFAAMKGVPDYDIEDAVLQALKDVDLEDQLETLSVNLSGGQKRKLSVAIALIGDPKLIFLDEPTAGMDPYSRRHLWGLLKKKKEGCTVLLTTHFMDEADILADRKAFIRNGKLRCCGSSLFLKNKFGIGYHLTMVGGAKCDVDGVTSSLQSIIPSVQHQRSLGKEIAYTVPLSEVGRFSALFKHLDLEASSLSIKNYGVSMSTLEEVFLRLEAEEGYEEENDADGLESAKQENVTIDFDQGQPFLKSSTEGFPLWKQRFLSLLKLRFLLIFRSANALFLQIGFPVLLVVVSLLALKIGSDSGLKTSDPLLLESSLYASTSNDSSMPKLMILDGLRTNTSQDIISALENRVSVNSYILEDGKRFDMVAVAPHYVGIKLMQNPVNQSLEMVTLLYNGSALHSLPVLVSMVTQNLLDMDTVGLKVNAFSWPWPQLRSAPKYSTAIMIYTLLIAFALILPMPGFSFDVVRDRELKLRSQLRISGLGFNLYWGTTYLSNLIVYLIPALLIFICALAFQIDGLTSDGAIAALCLMMLTNIPFNIFFGLVLSFFFDKAETCLAVLSTFLQFAGMGPSMIVMVVDSKIDEDTASLLHTIFCIIDPIYILFGGFYYIARVYVVAVYTGHTLTMSDYFVNEIVITMIIPLIHIAWMYWLLRVLDTWKMGGAVLDAFPCLAKYRDPVSTVNNDIIQDEDDDVVNERSRIEQLSSLDQPGEVAYVLNLRKVFKKRIKANTKRNLCGPEVTKVAVRNLSFGVAPGEVFGLLGPNGAGKSTALNMMIAEIVPSCGKVIINGHNIRSNALSLLNSLGYCPQHDALWETITLQEHIKCFAAIKGVSPEHIDSTVNYYISSLKLEEHRNKKVKELSGGTKRKLSYILSILGSPQFVLMDEPSTGMDPQSKRFLWDTINKTFRDSERGAVLTTHYMEEADALCSRVGIMVNGQFECLGTNQHLKTKYGSGYILEVKLASRHADQMNKQMDSLEKRIKALFPDMERVERFMERAQYSIPKSNVTNLGDTFASLEKWKSSHNIEEYSFSQNTLEQVFLFFAKQQMDEAKEETMLRQMGFMK